MNLKKVKQDSSKQNIDYGRYKVEYIASSTTLQPQAWLRREKGLALATINRANKKYDIENWWNIKQKQMAKQNVTLMSTEYMQKELELLAPKLQQGILKAVNIAVTRLDQINDAVEKGEKISGSYNSLSEEVTRYWSLLKAEKREPTSFSESLNTHFHGVSMVNLKSAVEVEAMLSKIKSEKGFEAQLSALESLEALAKEADDSANLSPAEKYLRDRESKDAEFKAKDN